MVEVVTLSAGKRTEKVSTLIGNTMQTGQILNPMYQNRIGKTIRVQRQSLLQRQKAVINFVNSINPYASVSYHSSGEILFWNFRQTGSWYNRDHAYAKDIGKMTGYRLIYPGPNPSGGGFTDWFIINYKRPAFTPEISRYYGETNPPVSEFSRVWNQNKAVGYM